MNLFVGFRAVIRTFHSRRVVLRCTASSVYRAFVNGVFCGYGPARGPHGWFRVDEWDITQHCHKGRTVVAFEVAGYNVNNYYLPDQPPFLQAEVIADGQSLAATGNSATGFDASVLNERVQKVQRYSYQRPFVEVYRLTRNYAFWRTDLRARFTRCRCSILKDRRLLPRRVPYPEFAVRRPIRSVGVGGVGLRADPPGDLWTDRALTEIGPQFKGFHQTELTVIPSFEIGMCRKVRGRSASRLMKPDETLSIPARSYRIVDFGTNLTGFIGARFVCRERTRVFLLFDEILSCGDVDFKRCSCVNIVTCEMAPGCYTFESFEPYTLRYLKLVVMQGSCKVNDVSLREYANPDVRAAHFAASDERFNRLFRAGVETFRQNALDVFMDCPSRERAGWLCDAFFTARVAPDVSGDTTVEKNFFENFLLPGKFSHIPSGMLPMCYPADHNKGVFIPNWALWFVVQLEEYLSRSGDLRTVELLKPKILALFRYFARYRNSDGLLEKLENRIFVEWSKANEFCQDVNYPTNMLYAGALDAAARMHRLPRLAAQAAQVRSVIRRQSFDGRFFVDNAVRENGRLEVTRNRTEACQYYAFFFDVAGPRSHPRLWRNLVRRFGPQRRKAGAFPEVHTANSFVGNMLRVEILSRYGQCRRILSESIDYLLYMAEKTGTLWEHTGATASCNHGFASHIVHTLYRDGLGVLKVDSVEGTVLLRFSDVGLKWCEGRIPVPGGELYVRWRRTKQALVYSVNVPAGFAVGVRNCTGLPLVRDL